MDTLLPYRRPSTVGHLVLGAVVAITLVTACDPPDGDEGTPTGCAATVRDASFAIEVSEQVRLLDAAMVACPSYDALGAEMARYPGIVGYSVDTFVALRCSNVTDDAVRRSATCQTVVDPTTTTPRTTLPILVFVGDTLDGRRVEIRPSTSTPFDGDVPAVVQQTVDIAFESGCDGVIAQRDLWASRVSDPEIGDEASVYAQHAQNVADYIQCDSLPVVTG